MFEVFGVPSVALFGQLLIGLINGSFYALMSLGVAIIFGMLRIANFVQGAQFMLGAFCAWFLLSLPELFPGSGLPSIGYWPALIIVPLVVGGIGWVTEKLFISRVYTLDHAYGVLLTLGLALVIEGLFQVQFGAVGQPYDLPKELSGGTNLGFMFLPNYRVWVIVASIAICIGTWFAIERTKLGAYLRAATENPTMVQAFGINVPRMLTLTYALGVGLAGLAGVMAAPIYQVSPKMGQSIIIVIFAIVVIGGMGSILGSIVSGFVLGVVEGLTKVFYPEASSTAIFIIMMIVLLVRPQGLFGGGSAAPAHSSSTGIRLGTGRLKRPELTYFGLLALLGVLAPLVFYPIFLCKLLCFVLFACAYNLVFGYVGLIAFGHAAFYGAGVYAVAASAKFWGWPPELALLFGVAVSGLLGLVIGWLAIRRQGLYFAMITLALAQLVYFFVVQSPWTNGEDGIQSVPRGELFGFIDLTDTTTLYGFVLVVVLLGFAILHRVIRSPFGQVLRSIRDNEPRAISLGYDADRFKLVAFVLSAAFSGLAGGLMAIIFQIAILTDISFYISAEVLLMVLIGGVGTVMGPVVGAVVLVTMQHYLSQLGSWVLIAQGAVFVLCVMTLRKGVVGSLAEYVARLRQRRDGGKGAAKEPPGAPRIMNANATSPT
jgi:branched-chain amino acid transport system permease protein